MKFKALVRCSFEIEIEEEDIEFAKESIEMDEIQSILDMEREESTQIIQVTDIKEII